MKKTLYTGIIITMLLIIPDQLKSQETVYRKEVNDTVATPDSLLLNIVPMTLTQSDEKIPELSEIKLRNGQMEKSESETSIIAPKISYFKTIADTETVNKTQTTLRSSSAISSEVGEITMTQEVSPNGSLTVNIPVELPKSTINLVPSISLYYNSLSGNGIAGAGWNIAGLFPVTCRNKSIYYDGYTAPGHPTIDLCWEGKRLIYKYTGNGSQFYELESSSGTVTATFNISSETLNINDSQGNEYHYKYHPYDNPYNLSFRLEQIIDRHNNYIDYQYLFNNGFYYISRIVYGGNRNMTDHTRLITFSYETRPDQTLYYPNGSARKLALRLTHIATGSKEYTLNYINSYYSLLSNIQCQVVNLPFTQFLEPLSFSYGEGVSNSGNLNKQEKYMSTYYTEGNYNTIHAVGVKFAAGNEEEGVAIYPKKEPYQWGEFKGHGYKTLHSMYSPENNVFISPTYADSDEYFGVYQVKLNEGFRGLVTLDADNNPDNREVVLINATGGWTNFTQTISFRVISSGLGFIFGRTKTVNFTLPAHYMHNGYTSVTPISYQTGNFKGDGIERILGVQHANNEPYSPSAIYLFDLKTNNYFRYSPPFSIETTDKIIGLDYDGDGKTDLYHFHNNGFDVYSFNPNNPASSTDMSFSLGRIAASTAITSHHFLEEEGEKKGNIWSARWYARRNVLFGDINGDGKMDILKTAKYGCKDGVPLQMNDNIWTQVLSTGNGGFDVTAYEMPNVWLNTYYDVLMHDFNGDGRSDVVCLKNDVLLQVIHSDGFRINQNLLSHYVVNGANCLDKLFTIGINQSNHNRMIGIVRGPRVLRLSIDRNETTNAFLTSTLSSHNVRTNISYKRIDDPDSYNEYCYLYAPGYEAQFPFENYKGCYWVVSNLNQQYRGTYLSDLYYGYNNAVVHKQGLGFCGFENIFTYDGITDRYNTTIYDPFHFGLVKRIYADDREIENTYDLSFTGNKEPNFRLTKQAILDHSTNNITTVNNTFDVYGNLTKSVTQYGSDLTKEITTDYYEGKIGFPLNITTKTIRSGDVFSTSSHLTYNNKLLPEKTVEKINGNIVSQTVRTFDAFSNVIQEDRIPYEATDKKRTKSFVYSDNGSKLIKTINELGQETEYEYVNEFLEEYYQSENPTGSEMELLYYPEDLIHSVKDFRGNIVKYMYSASKKLLLQINPDNTVEQTTYAYDAQGNYTITQKATNRPTLKTHYDGLHRIVKEEKQSPHSVVYKTTEYDYRGRVSRVSLPYHDTPTAWDTYSYDFYDRLTSINYASGKTETYSYNGNSVTSVIEGIRTTKTFDAAGQLVGVTDPAGTISYQLRADGQPASITAPGNAVTSFTYDVYGRKISISDPSAGMQYYTYDAAGNISSEKNANNKTISYHYDTYNRLIKKIRPEFTTSYTYNEDGLLSLESSNNGTSTNYIYDSYGRLSEKKETIVDGKFLQKNYAYADGRLSSLTYSNPSGTIATENYTYTNGHLTEIKLNGTTSIWRQDHVDVFGQPTQVTTGPLVRSYGYNTYGFPTSRKTSYFQDFTYEFDADKENLLFRKNNRYGKQENFTYDDLNRLTGYGTQTTAYDQKGNITHRSDIGDFSYNTSGKPYAVSRVDVLSSNVIPLREQYVSMTSFSRPLSINENGRTASFIYNGQESRVKMELKKNGVTELTRHYISDCYEIDNESGALKEKLYLGGDFYSAPAVYINRSTGNNWQIHYICRDYLGSITHVTNSSGSYVQEMDYDAWGRMRVPYSQSLYAPGSEPALFLGRGYGGHEHLTKFGLINMNARLYDPAVGRFLAPDPYVQAPAFSQSFNRYSYCLNNPLKYTDPDGEWVWIVVGAVVGGVINWGMHGFQWNMDGLAAFGTGAAGGALAATTGGAALGAFGTTAGAGGFVGGAVAGGVGYTFGTMTTSMGNNAFFGDPMPTGEQFLTGLGTSMLGGGVINGTIAAVNGSNFWTGAKAPQLTVQQLTQQTQNTGTQQGQTKTLQPQQPNNPIPNRVARVVPGNSESPMLGLENQERVFVTAAEDIHGLNASQIANKLSIDLPESGFKIYEFQTPLDGIATPIRYANPNFIGNGLTLGGAREFTVPNYYINNINKGIVIYRINF
jgi:RHS repeat-associated protein